MTSVRNHRQYDRPAPRPTRGRGIILPVVLMIFALLALLALGFGFLVRSEYLALQARGGVDQSRLCAMSGLEAAALLLRHHFAEPSAWYDREDLFRDQVVQADTTQDQARRWRYSLVGCNLDNDKAVRFGLTDEAAKVNLNVASPDQLQRLLAPFAPMGKTEELVAALLDWREQGGEMRPGGGKDLYYLTLPQPYQCKEAPLDTIEELLLVKDFTADVVFGEDMNRNGILDANEDDADLSLPVDNGDGLLNRGLYPYITVYSREPEVTDGNPYLPRVNINLWPEGAAGKLPDKLVSFIVKARGARADFGRTPANLIGMSAGGAISPATEADLPAIMDLLTTGYHVHSDGFVYGRINVNTAPGTVLRTIGRLTAEEVEGILTTRARLSEEIRKTTAWLVTEKVLDVEKYKQVACLLTARSYQFTVESLGYCEYDSAQCRMQAVMELRLPRVQYLYLRDLSGLGRSYRLAEFKGTDVITKQNVSGRNF